MEREVNNREKQKKKYIRAPTQKKGFQLNNSKLAGPALLTYIICSFKGHKGFKGH